MKLLGAAALLYVLLKVSAIGHGHNLPGTEDSA